MNELAKATNFVQREGKIDGEIFFELIVFQHDHLKEQSLGALAELVEQDYQIDICRQALHKRFNAYAVAFLKTALEKVLQQQLQTSALKLLDSSFQRVLIKDSVCFQIDESLAEIYPGSGGSGSGAAIRIQFEYNLLTGTITEIAITAFNLQDSKDSLATIEKTQEGDLVIRDLAYMSIAVLKKIIEKQALFLCRPNTSVNMFELKHGNYVKLDFNKIIKSMRKHNLAIMEKEIYYSSADKIKTRLIIHLLPMAELEKRLRAASKKAKKKGHKISNEYKTRAALNLFITNATEKQIPTNKVWSIYRLRWQIELMFKIWKSICDIEKVKKVNQHRLECYLYSKLIFIVLGWQVVWTIAKNMYSIAGKALSFFKAFKSLFKIQLGKFRAALRSTLFELMINFIVDFYNLSVKNHLLEKRKQAPTSLEIIVGCLN